MSYVYNKLERNQIRVIDILETSPQISISLSTHDRADAPHYTALSYAWGLEIETALVLCNGQSLPIRANLAEALQDIHAAWPNTLFWIDAICINQRHAAEKEAQVYSMDSTFKSAERVVAYLGPARDKSDEVMACLNRIKDRPEPVDFDYADDHTRMRIVTKPVHHKSTGLFNESMLAPFQCFSERSWFRRLWVLQEYVLARTVVMQCGTTTIPAMEFRRCCSHISIHAFGRAVPAWYMVDGGIFRGFEAFVNLHSLRRGRICGTSLDFFELVMSGSTRLVTEHADRVYAMLGLATNAVHAYKDSIALRYASNPSSSYCQAYEDFSRHALLHEPNLRLFNFVGSQKTLPGMPSWCADLTDCARPYPMWAVVEHKQAGWPAGDHAVATGHISKPDSTTKPHDRGTCTRHPAFSGKDHNHVHFRPQAGHLLIVAGAVVDDIQELGPAQKWHMNFNMNNIAMLVEFVRDAREWIAGALALMCRHNSSIEQSIGYLYTILFNMSFGMEDNDRSGTPKEFWMRFARDLDTLDTKLTELLQSDDLLTIDNLTMKTPIYDTNGRKCHTVEEFLQPYIHIHDFIGRIWVKRVLFATRKGALGFAAIEVQPGDKICMLYGGETLYVLRPYSDESGEYQFISNAFVSGYMRGQTFDLLDAGEVKEEHFRIR